MTFSHLSRAYSPATQALITGYYVCVNGTDHYICTGKNDPEAVGNALAFAPIDPNTLSACLGERDSENNFIFEGDVISVRDKNGAKEVYRFSVQYGICARNIFAQDTGYPGFYFVPADEETAFCCKFGLRDDPMYYLKNSQYICVVVGQAEQFHGPVEPERPDMVF